LSDFKIPRKTPSFVVPAEDMGTQVEVDAGVKAGDQVI
jgi:hypothetical protein